LTGSISAGGWRGRGRSGWRGPPGASTSEVFRAQDGIAYGYGIDHNSPVSAPTITPPAPVHRRIPHHPVEIIQEVIPAPIIREIPVPVHVPVIDNRAVLMDGRMMMIDDRMILGDRRGLMINPMMLDGRMMIMDDGIMDLPMRAMLDGRRIIAL